MNKTFKGKLVTIRPPVKSDAESIYKYIRSPDIPRYTFVPSPYTLNSAYDFIKRSHGWRRKGTSYVFAIVSNEVGEMVGGIGVHAINKIHKKAEIGYWLGKRFRGRGYMQEAIELALNFCFKNLKLHRVQASTLLDNVTSQKLLLSCGFKYEGTHRSFYRHRNRSKDAHMYAILKSEFSGKSAK